MTSKLNHRQTGFSLLELIVTLFILAIVMSAVVILLQQTHFQIRHINQNLSRKTLLNHSLDSLMDDLIENASDDIDIQQRNSSSLTLKTESSSYKLKPAFQIDWATASDQDDLVLYRRFMKISNPTNPLYYPICDHIDTFTINMLDSRGEPSPDQESIALIEVQATMFREDQKNPDYVHTARRIFALNRFDF